MKVEIDYRAYLHDLLEVFLQFRRINLNILVQSLTIIFFWDILKVFKDLRNNDRNMSNALELFQYFIFFLVALFVIFVVDPFLLNHVTNVLDGTRFKPVAHFVDIGQPFPVTIELFYPGRRQSISFEFLLEVFVEPFLEHVKRIFYLNFLQRGFQCLDFWQS